MSAARQNSNFAIELPRTPQRSGAKQEKPLLSQSNMNPKSASKPELSRRKEEPLRPELSRRKEEPPRPEPSLRREELLRPELSMRREFSMGREESPRPELNRRREGLAQQPFEMPSRAQRNTFNFITMGIIQLDSTTTRAWISKWILLLTIKMLSMLTAALFWLALPIYAYSLYRWQAPLNIFYDLTSRYSSGSVSTIIWRHIFPATEFSSGHQLKLVVHQTSYLQSQTFYSTSIPLFLENPIAWLFLMTFMFTSHHLLCFAYDSLDKQSYTN